MLNGIMKSIAVGLLVVAVTATGTIAQSANREAEFPPNAKPGECYARVFVPPTYKTETETILVKDASERLEIIPARYEWVAEKVLVKEASERLEIVPATYDWVMESVLVKPAATKEVEVPAVYKTATERVLDQPAHTVWKKGEGAGASARTTDDVTGEVMCLVEVPATYKTITKTVLASPATTKTVEIPAEYKKIKKRVMTTPPEARKITIPAEYETVKVRKLVSPEQVKKIAIPSESKTVTKRVKLTEGHLEWRLIVCETNATPHVIRQVQQALSRAGHNPGPIDGVLGAETMNAVKSFQKRKGLPSGFLTIETLEALNVNHRI
jgi:hypothetical protein